MEQMVGISVAFIPKAVHLTLREATGTAIPSFSSTLLEGGVSPEEEDVIMWTSMTIYLGMFTSRSYLSRLDIFSQVHQTRYTLSCPENQVYTNQSHLKVVSAIHAFFLAMVLFPEVQARAQAELDAVVGSKRLPSFDDRDSLPYINAVWKEVLRWHSVTPLGTVSASSGLLQSAHRVEKQRCPTSPQKTFIPASSSSPKDRTSSETCGEYRAGLPAHMNMYTHTRDSTDQRLSIECAHRAVLHDAFTYPDPGVFRPERFLGETPQPDPQNVCFGFGRR